MIQHHRSPPPWACYIVDVPRAWQIVFFHQRLDKIVIGLVGIPKTNSIWVCQKAMQLAT